MRPAPAKAEQALDEAEALLLHIRSQDISNLHQDVFAILIDTVIERIQSASEFIESIK